MFQRMGAIALNTLSEVVRQPIYGILLFSSAVIICLSPTFSMYTMTEDVKIMQDMGLATLLLTGLLLAAFSASGVIWREIENKTVLTVITKPVSAFEFVVAKFAGILLALAAAMYMLTLILTLMVRIGVPETASFEMDWPVASGLIAAVVISMVIGACANYFFNKNFTSSSVSAAIPIITLVFVALCFFNKKMEIQAFGEDMDWNLVKACVLVSLAVFIIGALATALSTRLGTVMNIIICFTILIMGLLSDYMFGMSQENILARIAYGVLPNMQIFWLADALTMDKTITISYTAYAVVYAALYQAAAVSLAVFGFSTRELS